MTTEGAQATMDAHYAEHHCSRDGDTGCPVAVENYARYLTALAVDSGVHPESFPGVRAWMRANGREPIPMDEAMVWKAR